ncbi:MAG: diphthine synthase [Candidatus Nitrosocosmicus sp.]|nr:diphthine synthase [Candidatus Nitrosocosmicus sp.]MDN5865858.1 diphthine synthase [Candidatus Nitrosocosmicus sp.]
MLYIIGIGINEFKSLPLGSMEILRSSDIVYVERFTGFISDEFVRNLSDTLQMKNASKSRIDIDIKFIKRWFIEDGREILENAQKSLVCILVYGDPLVATTYNELLVRARKLSIDFKIVHSSSGILSLMGESGLQPYKFGKMVTMMDDPMSSITVYDTIYENMCLGLHTLILTEYNNDDGKNNFQSSSDPFYLSPRRVIELLLEREEEIKLLNFSIETYGMVASKIGQKGSTISSGTIKSLLKLGYSGGPNSIIIPGRLHFIEVDSIKYLTNMIDEPTDNTERVSRLAHRMLDKYLPNTKVAVDNMYHLIRTESYGLSKDYAPVIENAENYLLDAQNFYNQGKLELAILSVGYAEGLIDSIRFQKNINPW